MPVSETPLLEAAVAMRGAASDEWQRFVTALNVYANGITSGLFRASPDQLVRLQGFAQATFELATMLETAHLELEKVRAKELEAARKKMERK